MSFSIHVCSFFFQQLNGFGDFDESTEEDVEYDGIDAEEYKVGEAGDDNIGDLHLETSNDLGNEQSDNIVSFQAPFRELGAKRHRPNSNIPLHTELGRQQHFEFTRPHSVDRDGAQERQQHNDFQSLNSSVNSGLSQSPQSQSGLLHGAASHFQQVTHSSHGDRGVRRSDNDDEDMIFARYIASELRQLKDANLKRLVKHKIQNLVFDAHCNPQGLSSTQM